jgi:hypothetical protein
MTMQLQFNKPITLGTETYGKGQHTVFNDAAKGWFFDALVEAGDIVVLRKDEPAQFIEPEAATEAKATRKNKKATEATVEDEIAPEGE